MSDGDIERSISASAAQHTSRLAPRCVREMILAFRCLFIDNSQKEAGTEKKVASRVSKTTESHQDHDPVIANALITSLMVEYVMHLALRYWSPA